MNHFQVENELPNNISSNNPPVTVWTQLDTLQTLYWEHCNK